MQSNPYLASVEQRIATAKIDAAALVATIELLRASDMRPDARAGMIAEVQSALDLVTRLMPEETPILDDAIARLEAAGQSERAAQLKIIRAEVRESLSDLHTFVDFYRNARPARVSVWWWRAGLAALVLGDILARLFT